MIRRISALQPLPGIALATLAYVCGYAVRYGLVEPERFGAACEKAGPWWCAPRTGFIVFTHWNGFGWAGLAIAALGVGLALRAARRDGRLGGTTPAVHALAMAAMAVGGAGLVLYNSAFSAVAVVAALLLLCRRPAPGEAPHQAG
ncbi:MAG: hypothetical protein VW338_05240 [Rhodospirillaceae bacterium]